MSDGDENHGKTRFAFCNSMTSAGPWHIRRLTDRGRTEMFTGIDTPSLCGFVPAGAGGFDYDMEFTDKYLLFASHCRSCTEKFWELTGHPPRLLCKCGRSQLLAPSDAPDGITVEEAHLVGWRFQEDGTVMCPICSGNLKPIVAVPNRKGPS